MIYLFYSLSAKSDVQNVRYIGVTTASLNVRFSLHKYCARHEEKRRLPVHFWMHKHYLQGDDIVITKIGECDETEWEEKEKSLIALYKTNGYKLLNIDEGGVGVVTIAKRTIDSRIRSADAHKKAVVLFDCSGKIIAQCNSCREAGKKFNLSVTAIGNVLKGRSQTVGGYYIVYKSTYDSPEFDIQKYLLTANSNSKSKKFVYQFDLQGNLIHTYPKLQDVPFDRNAISHAINKKWNIHGCFWAKEASIDVNDYTVRMERDKN